MLEREQRGLAGEEDIMGDGEMEQQQRLGLRELLMATGGSGWRFPPLREVQGGANIRKAGCWLLWPIVLSSDSPASKPSSVTNYKCDPGQIS